MAILQLALQRPELAILDETDSGLDIAANESTWTDDALRSSPTPSTRSRVLG